MWKLWVALAILGAGIVGGMYLGNVLYYPGCTFRLFSAGSFVVTECQSPFEQRISFGSSPSPRPLHSALEIVQEMTQGKQEARIFVDKDVLAAEFAKREVTPPAGPQSAISVTVQLLAHADASDKVDLCLAPSAGFRLKLRR